MNKYSLLNLPFVSSLLQPRKSCPCAQQHRENAKMGVVLVKLGRGQVIFVRLCLVPPPIFQHLSTHMKCIYDGPVLVVIMI